MIKKLTNKKAFTLTELIVVIVIIGILAAVLIPALTGYINKAKETAALQEAQPYVTAYSTWVVEGEETEDLSVSFRNYCVELELSKEANTGLTVTGDGTIAGCTGFTIVIDGYTVEYTVANGLSVEKAQKN